ncbi:MAG: substrate-binding domain-containing protein [Flavobacteriaceae bacterium]|nr:substrate-binding domain-containing protein [Flavobacteriaceae bacterium]
MKTVKIIGVPEHFNLPWHMAIEEGAFAKRGIKLRWTDIPEGTGRMSEMLANEKTDLAIILTEGIIKSILAGNPSKIVQTYIQSPLLWGIHQDASSSSKDVKDLEHKPIAISRYGSGSHLMSFLHAGSQNWNTKKLVFDVVQHLDGAIQILSSGKEHYFMWEKYTTKPLVDNGTFKRLGVFPSPWPCFVIAATDSFISKNQAVLHAILEVINDYSREFKHIPSIDRTLANRYGQKLEDIQEWLGLTQWSQSNISQETIALVQDKLHQLQIIEEQWPYSKIVYC